MNLGVLSWDDLCKLTSKLHSGHPLALRSGDILTIEGVYAPRTSRALRAWFRGEPREPRKLREFVVQKHHGVVSITPLDSCGDTVAIPVPTP